MSEPIDVGGPAYRVPHGIDGNRSDTPRPEYSGVSTRMWLAGMSITAAAKFPPSGMTDPGDWIAKRALQIADAVIAADKRGA